MKAKDLLIFVQSHLFTVCPILMPSLPTENVKDMNETEFMESLGMAKTTIGEFETFERFLSRTENLISISAAMMCSRPSSHSLMGGNRGALEFIERFLQQITLILSDKINEKSFFLPLITAPVLVSFLTIAGHMLARKFPDEFSSLLTNISQHVYPHVDTGTFGAPSAVRLKKVIDRGFEGFNSALPEGAVPDCYSGASVTPNPISSTRNVSNPSNAALKTSTSMRNPFGQPIAPTQNPNMVGMSIPTPQRSSPLSPESNPPNPFSLEGNASCPPSSPSNTLTTMTNPFRQLTSSSQNPNSFGMSIDQKHGFASSVAAKLPNQPGSTSGTSTPMTNPFGQPTAPTQNPNPFAMSINQSQGFGLTSAANTPNQSISTSNTSSSMSSPFGQYKASTQNLNPFGMPLSQENSFGFCSVVNATNPSSSTSNYSTGITSPFGPPIARTQNSNPFGISIDQKNASEIFGDNSTSLGSSNVTARCKYHAKGYCRFGNNCKFSHSTS